MAKANPYNDTRKIVPGNPKKPKKLESKIVQGNKKPQKLESKLVPSKGKLESKKK